MNEAMADTKILLMDIFFLLLSEPGCPEHQRFNCGVDHERSISIVEMTRLRFSLFIVSEKARGD
jgi:hypothetical protein